MAQKDSHFIEVVILDDTRQYIYYEDSILLRRLSLYPYVQLAVMLALILIIYVAVIYTKRAEQNRVWVGLSKETAHQLGTPISSLMAWSQYLELTGADKEVTTDDHGVRLSRPLFEWVMENLTKNAVDAMDGEGRIEISTGTEKNLVYIEIKDTGKGIARKNFKTVFKPGYTTKKRGWGLGLTLVKRIIEEYHGGRIYVKSSEIGQGTTFRIELPLL